MVADAKQELAQLEARYEAAMHAVQTGVAAEIEHKVSDAHTPKHLRTGVNSAMIEHSALAKLLIDKGVITHVEYMRALVEMAEREKTSYEASLSRALGVDIKLA